MQMSSVDLNKGQVSLASRKNWLKLAMFHKKRDRSSLTVRICTFLYKLFCIKAVYLSNKLSLMCPRLWPIEGICICLYALMLCYVIVLRRISD